MTGLVSSLPGKFFHRDHRPCLIAYQESVFFCHWPRTRLISSSTYSTPTAPFSLAKSTLAIGTRSKGIPTKVNPERFPAVLPTIQDLVLFQPAYPTAIWISLDETVDDYTDQRDHYTQSHSVRTPMVRRRSPATPTRQHFLRQLSASGVLASKCLRYILFLFFPSFVEI